MGTITGQAWCHPHIFRLYGDSVKNSLWRWLHGRGWWLSVWPCPCAAVVGRAGWESSPDLPSLHLTFSVCNSLGKCKNASGVGEEGGLFRLGSGKSESVGEMGSWAWPCRAPQAGSPTGEEGWGRRGCQRVPVQAEDLVLIGLPMDSVVSSDRSKAVLGIPYKWACDSCQRGETFGKDFFTLKRDTKKEPYLLLLDIAMCASVSWSCGSHDHKHIWLCQVAKQEVEGNMMSGWLHEPWNFPALDLPCFVRKINFCA